MVRGLYAAATDAARITASSGHGTPTSPGAATAVSNSGKLAVGADVGRKHAGRVHGPLREASRDCQRRRAEGEHHAHRIRGFYRHGIHVRHPRMQHEGRPQVCLKVRVDGLNRRIGVRGVPDFGEKRFSRHAGRGGAADVGEPHHIPAPRADVAACFIAQARQPEQQCRRHAEREQHRHNRPRGSWRRGCDRFFCSRYQTCNSCSKVTPVRSFTFSFTWSARATMSRAVVPGWATA